MWCCSQRGCWMWLLCCTCGLEELGFTTCRSPLCVFRKAACFKMKEWGAEERTWRWIKARILLETFVEKVLLCCLSVVLWASCCFTPCSPLTLGPICPATNTCRRHWIPTRGHVPFQEHKFWFPSSHVTLGGRCVALRPKEVKKKKKTTNTPRQPRPFLTHGL